MAPSRGGSRLARITASDWLLIDDPDPREKAVNCIVRIEALSAVATPPEVETALLQFRLLAVHNRMLLYDLATPEEAIRCILRERAQDACRLPALPAPAIADMSPSFGGSRPPLAEEQWRDPEMVRAWMLARKVAQCGGLRDDVEVVGVEDWRGDRP